MGRHRGAKSKAAMKENERDSQEGEPDMSAHPALH